MLLPISTSGRCQSILNAAHAANELGIRVIGLIGRPDSALEAMCEACICTPCGAYADRVQEMQIKVIHILIELVERKLYPDNYAD